MEKLENKSEELIDKGIYRKEIPFRENNNNKRIERLLLEDDKWKHLVDKTSWEEYISPTIIRTEQALDQILRKIRNLLLIVGSEAD